MGPQYRYRPERLPNPLIARSDRWVADCDVVTPSRDARHPSVPLAGEQGWAHCPTLLGERSQDDLRHRASGEIVRDRRRSRSRGGWATAATSEDHRRRGDSHDSLVSRGNAEQVASRDTSRRLESATDDRRGSSWWSDNRSHGARFSLTALPCGPILLRFCVVGRGVSTAEGPY